MSEAWAEGIPLKGYIYWSCMDNFEWNDGGSTAGFGPVRVDYSTKQRMLKRSAYFLRNWFDCKREVCVPVSQYWLIVSCNEERNGHNDVYFTIL
ncbi:glycoside hydrolase superfamily [Jimgerdemannia flammicorona]|uniref:Glycoside hydrolase superfamily n=1 Tax=Jimgerdemannia flammicorona TaxID=994334 RepID=A0A433D9L3_9FUNG|nr:glycoside hydrolase superfamily [Jimgerdemannia flammicorona]